MADQKPPHDRALELLVYAPVGVALYVRDMLPTMMTIFVSRGKREVQSHLPGQVPEPPPMPAPPSPADVRRRIEEGIGLAKLFTEGGLTMARGVAGTGIGLARDVAGSAAQAAQAAQGFVPPRPSPADSPLRPPRAPAAESPLRPPRETAPADDAPTGVGSAEAAWPPGDHTEGAPTPAGGDASAPLVEALAIPDYDELSASQVVERLDGLDAASLDAIRRYESAHRGRNTILGKIAQLT